MNKKPTTSAASVATTKALTQAQVRKLLVEGRRVRRELEARVEKMHRVSPTDAAARAR
jgi:glutamate-1-semialdehyde aminotransferase